MKKIKGHFLSPVHPSIRTTRALRALVGVGLSLDREVNYWLLEWASSFEKERNRFKNVRRLNNYFKIYSEQFLSNFEIAFNFI